MMKTRLRPATHQDFPILLEIDQACFTPGVAYSADELSHFMESSGAETIVADKDEVIAAFLLMNLDRENGVATLVTLDVREQYRKRGLASRLISESEKRLIRYGIGLYVLQVDTTNDAAIRLYKRHGFVPVRLLRRYYANGADAYLMAKRLKV